MQNCIPISLLRCWCTFPLQLFWVLTKYICYLLNICENISRCRIGSLVEFSIFPSWESSKKGKFYCHIKPVAKQRLLEIKYSVQSRNRAEAIHTATVQVDGGDTWERDGRAIFKYVDMLVCMLLEKNTSVQLSSSRYYLHMNRWCLGLFKVTITRQIKLFN